MVKKDVGSPKSTSFMSTFYIGSMFVFPASFLCRPHTQTRIGLSFCQRISIPSLELFFPNRVPKDLSLSAFPIIVLPEDDHTDFAHEGRLDLPHWNMIGAILCFR